ncbi:hypothetical protein V2J09_023997 [Rumex salicifolius]
MGSQAKSEEKLTICRCPPALKWPSSVACVQWLHLANHKGVCLLGDRFFTSMTPMLIFFISCLSILCISCMKRMNFVALITRPSCGSMAESVENEGDDKLSFLDLPDLALDCILEKLSPTDLCSMAGVCSYLRERCISDYLWESHMNKKWGRVIGESAFKDWQFHGASSNGGSQPNRSICEGFGGYLLSFWPLSFVTPKLKGTSKNGDSLPSKDSLMKRYLSLEKGSLWFVAQVYNRENGHGFLLSCYDAELSYDSTSNTFKARYSPRGRHTVEENIAWDRLRSPPVNTPPNALHPSDCLEDLNPGDHFEIQWRRNKDYPYGWWYGVVGHLDSCIRNENWCRCHDSETVMLEFNQYPVDSRWRRTTVNRGNQRQQGNEADGFYGGIRKLYDSKEISTWQSIWPKNILD